MLFEIWIVDASIFVVVAADAVCCLSLLCGGVNVLCLASWLGWGVGCFLSVGWGVVVLVVTSCEGHMVDALASRADEGRWSLR